MGVVKLSASAIAEGKRRVARNFSSRPPVRVPGEIKDLFAIKTLEDECKRLFSWRHFGDNRAKATQISHRIAVLSNAYFARYGKSADTRRIR